MERAINRSGLQSDMIEATAECFTGSGIFERVTALFITSGADLCE